jgi:hypothetical protein
MLRSMIAVAVVAVSAGLAAANSNAGLDHLEFPNLIMRVSASPPVAGTAAKPQPVGIEFDSLEYTDSGERSQIYTRTLAYRFNGFSFHPGAFAKCRESKLEKSGPKGCPAGSRLGTGTAVADARPTVPDKIKAKVFAFNGMLDVDSAGKPITPVPAVLILARAPSGLKAYVPVLFKGGDRLVTTDRPAPQDGSPPPFTIVRLSLKLPVKTRSANGKTVGYVEAPLSCPGGKWKFSQVNSTYSGEKLTATDTQPCVAAKSR